MIGLVIREPEPAPLRPVGLPTEPPPRRSRMIALALTLAAHAGAIALLLWPSPPRLPLPVPDRAPLEVTLLPTPQPPGPSSPDEAAAAHFITPPMPHVAPPVVRIARNISEVPPDDSDLLSDMQLAGAARLGEGGGAGGCDVGTRVQDALRRDPLVHSAVFQAGRQGKAILLWNGDWVRSGGQEGKGLSAAREAISWAIAFSPKACREQRMRGLLLLTGEAGTRFAIGTASWRWSDLLGLR